MNSVEFSSRLALLRTKPNEYDVERYRGRATWALDSYLLEEAARESGLKVHRVLQAFVTVTSDRRSGGFWRNIPWTLPLKMRWAADRKDVTKRWLRNRGVPVPVGAVFDSYDRALRFFREHSEPVTVKPVHGSHGRGVSPNVGTETEFAAAWEEARQHHSRIIVEEYVRGFDVRIMVVGGTACAAVYRDPANVVGDGESTVQELIDSKNRSRLANPHLRTRPIEVSPQALARLQAQRLSMDSRPGYGERVVLHEKANLSAGGDSIDVTDALDPSFLRLAERAMDAFPDLRHGGVDILAEDFSRPVSEQRHAICEINCNNVISLHHFPLYGTPRNVALTLIRHYFPEVDGAGVPNHSASAEGYVGLGARARGQLLRGRFGVQEVILRFLLGHGVRGVRSGIVS